MSETNCPICYTELQVIEASPCMECGHLSEEIEQALIGAHTYAEMRIFGDLTLVLCDFCQVDFGSSDPAFFGLPKNTHIGYEKMQFLRSIEDIRVGKDKMCPACQHRLAFLRFVQAARELHRSVKS